MTRKKLRIALYHLWLHSRGGGEQILLELLKRSRHHIEIFTHHYNPASAPPELAKHPLHVLARTTMPKGDLARGALFTALASTTKLPLQDFDALVVSTGGIAELILLRNHQLPALALVLTPLRAIHDPAIAAHKRSEQRVLRRAASGLAAAGYRSLERRAWKHVDLALCISKTTRQRMLAARLLPAARTRVLHPGADLSALRPGKSDLSADAGIGLRPGTRSFLYPSRFTYHKRQELALRAFLAYKQAHPGPFKLILAGGVNPEKRAYFEKIKALAKGHKDIVLKPDVRKNEWLHLYRHAYAVLFTAMNEDWGIVPLEAAACAKPVIAVNEGGPRESIVHNRTGLLVPATPEALARAMHALASDPARARRLGAAAKQRVQQYSWERFAAGFDAAVEEVARRSQPI